MLETSRGQSAFHLQILLVFFLCKCRLTPYRLPMECHMAFSFWIWFPEVECRLPYFLETMNSGNFVFLREKKFVDCDINNFGSNGGLVDSAFSFAKKTSICTVSSYIHTKIYW